MRIDSTFGKMAVLVTDEQLPYPYGCEINGYEVANLAHTMSNAKATVLVDPYTAVPIVGDYLIVREAHEGADERIGATR